MKAHLAVLLAFTAIATGLLASACGSSGHEEHARSLYIVDPLGNLMMRHDGERTSKDLLSDLKKLLKLSHIG